MEITVGKLSASCVIMSEWVSADARLRLRLQRVDYCWLCCDITTGLSRFFFRGRPNGPLANERSSVVLQRAAAVARETSPQPQRTGPRRSLESALKHKNVVSTKHWTLCPFRSGIETPRTPHSAMHLSSFVRRPTRERTHARALITTFAPQHLNTVIKFIFDDSVAKRATLLFIYQLYITLELRHYRLLRVTLNQCDTCIGRCAR